MVHWMDNHQATILEKIFFVFYHAIFAEFIHTLNFLHSIFVKEMEFSHKWKFIGELHL